MTSIEWGISVSNQRRREKEREWGRVRERERQKEGHSLASDESERRGNILKGSRASKSERKTEWRGETERGRTSEGNNEHLWFLRKTSKCWGHLDWHNFAVLRAAVCALCPFVFLHKFRRFVLYGPLNLSNGLIQGNQSSNQVNLANLTNLHGEKY